MHEARFARARDYSHCVLSATRLLFRHTCFILSETRSRTANLRFTRPMVLTITPISDFHNSLTEPFGAFTTRPYKRRVRLKKDSNFRRAKPTKF